MGMRLAYGTSKTCSRCGYYNKGGQAHSNCGLIIDRQENASINIGTNSFVGSYGFPPKGAKLDEFSDEPRG